VVLLSFQDIGRDEHGEVAVLHAKLLDLAVEELYRSNEEQISDDSAYSSDFAASTTHL
jgi:hypothetical protein